MVQKVCETIIAVAKEGVTMLLIEQNAKLALEVSDRGYVMESGEITLSGQASALLHHPKVRGAYLGEVAYGRACVRYGACRRGMRSRGMPKRCASGGAAPRRSRCSPSSCWRQIC